MITAPLGSRRFEEIRIVRMVEVVEQRDEPPGRGDKAERIVKLAESKRVINGQGTDLMDTIEEVNHS